MIKVSKVSPVAAIIILFNILCASLISTGKVYAAEVSSGNLLLLSTYIKTESEGLHIGPSTPAFSTTTVKCPRYLTCTIRIELSTQFANIQYPDVAAAEVTVDKLQAGVLPNSTLGLDVENTTFGSSTARTFSWMKKDIKGGHTVDVNFFTNTGRAADAGTRTLTIQVYSQNLIH